MAGQLSNGNGAPHGRKTWATLLTNSAYLSGVLALYRTMQAVSRYPLLIMTTDTLPQADRKVLLDAGLQIREVPHLIPAAGQHPGFDPKFLRLNDAWTKLQVWSLTEYDRVVLIDSDMIFLRGMDELFDLELPGKDWIAGAPACICNPLKFAHYPKDWVPANCGLTHQPPHTPLLAPPIPAVDGPRTSHLLNSGMVVLNPSDQTMNEIKHFLDTSPTVAEANLADQDVIAEFFKGKWRPLAWWANALKPLRAIHKSIWRDDEVRLIHYIFHDKPWHQRPEYLDSYLPRTASKNAPESLSELPSQLKWLISNTPEQESITDYSFVHGWWWVVYDDVLRRMLLDGKQDLVDIVEQSRLDR